MQFINIIQAALLVASHASASPIGGPDALAPNAINGLFKRAPITSVSCAPNVTSSLQTVQDAYDALVSRATTNTPVIVGRRSYPGPYGRPPTGIPSDASVVTALNAIPECVTGQAGKQYWEFPITNPVFAGGPPGSQGPDRVVAIANKSNSTSPPSSFIYCLAMTHRGVPGNTFQPCNVSAISNGLPGPAGGSGYLTGK